MLPDHTPLSGSDALYGGNGSDTASYETAIAAVTANLASPKYNKGDAYGDTYSSIENLTGSAFNDSLTGNSSNNVLIGGAGADKLYGKGGSDTASYETATAAVTANLASSQKNAGEAAGDTYSYIENLTGSAFDDNLTGNNAANVLNGGFGSDVLAGGAGRDTFWFRFTESNSNDVDIITDFNRSDDELRFDGLQVSTVDSTQDIDGDGRLDSKLVLDNGAQVHLLGVSDWFLV